MEYKNSYIFLKRSEEEKNACNEKNIIKVNLHPSFNILLSDTFDDISFDYDISNDSLNSGSFMIKRNNKKVKVFFKYHNVRSNYYLDIIVNTNRERYGVNILDEVNLLLIGKKNIFEKYYISIISYDYISEYYCNKLFPYLNEFERKLRKILFNVYTSNFNQNYYLATTSEEFQKDIKKNSNILKNEDIANQDRYIKLAFYSLDYSDIDKLLFTKSVTQEEIKKMDDFLNDNNDLSQLSDKKLRKAFKLCNPKTDWERFFGNKKIDENFQKILDDIRKFRNSIAHCKLISKNQYDNCLKLLKHNIESLNIAISITEETDFMLKNIELHQEALERISNIINETILKTYKPLMDGIEQATKPMRELSERMSKIVYPISNTLSKIVLPEAELSKYNIPNYFNSNDKNNRT